MADKKNPELQDDDPDNPHQRLDYLELVDNALTPEVWKKARAFARKRVMVLALGGHAVDTDLADQLVGDAVADTALGVCRWDPDRCELLTHLYWVIRGRTHKRSLRRRMVTETDIFDRLADEGAVIVESESPETLFARMEITLDFFRVLHDLAAERDDQEVVALLDAYRRGVTQRAEVAKEIGISAMACTRARARLSRLLEEIPARLRDEALAVMRGER